MQHLPTPTAEVSKGYEKHDSWVNLYGRTVPYIQAPIGKKKYKETQIMRINDFKTTFLRLLFVSLIGHIRVHTNRNLQVTKGTLNGIHVIKRVLRFPRQCL